MRGRDDVIVGYDFGGAGDKESAPLFEWPPHGIRGDDCHHRFRTVMCNVGECRGGMAIASAGTCQDYKQQRQHGCNQGFHWHKSASLGGHNGDFEGLARQEKCDSSAVYASAACREHDMRCRSTSESALAAPSGAFAKSRGSIRKRLPSAADCTGPTTAELSGASGTCRW